ncbi:MAG: hypothetical protein L0177_03725, partial [Chloroflexi bacterium]|nr:hypothetical protein [Chloroflexota bacterium]
SEFNSRITDLGLAPRNKKGLVEFASDVSIILPVDRERGSGRLMLDVVNRGNRVALPNFNRATRPTITGDTPADVPVDLGDGFLMRRGYTVVACGWQFDTPDFPALITMRQGQQAFDKDGKPLVGRVYMQLQSPVDTHNFLLSDKNHKPYPAYDMEERSAIMEVRDMPDGDAQPAPRDFWRFGRIDDSGNYVPDPGYVCSEKGFKKGLLYQIAYTTNWAPVLSLSFAALRDCVSWFKYGADSVAPPIEGIRYAYAYGRSQTGRYLRTYIYNDFNRDEQGREALDGIIANVAGGMRGEFNQRFGQNSKDRNNMMTQLFPFATIPQTDLETEETDSIHRRLDERGSHLKVFYTNTSAEYHRGDASLVHTDPDGRLDLDSNPNSRIYHFSGTEHGLGTWPPTDNTETGEGFHRAQNLRSAIDYTPLLRACLVNLDRWVAEGVPPPPSNHPRIADGTAVPPSALKKAFDRIPGASYPQRHALPRRRDYGLREDVEQVTTLPPRFVGIGKRYGSLVSAVDDDGNEVAGIKLPEIAVPLAAHTGWTLRHPDIGGERQLLMFAGGTIPFARDESERRAKGDPRPSIPERYKGKGDYLSRVRAAAEGLVKERYLLEEDIEVCLAQAAKFWDYFAT